MEIGGLDLLVGFRLLTLLGRGVGRKEGAKVGWLDAAKAGAVGREFGG